jgi:uncharacterized membrane protein
MLEIKPLPLPKVFWLKYRPVLTDRPATVVPLPGLGVMLGGCADAELEELVSS